MKAERLLPQDIEGFKAYCVRHRHEVDDSFPSDKHLAAFIPDAENPSCIVKDAGEIVAAASIIKDDYHKRGRNGRFRILHSEINDINIYALLLTELLKYADGLDQLFVFVPFINKNLAASLERLHFVVERYVYLLIRDITAPPAAVLPDGYSVRPFMPGPDEDDWCCIRNTAFFKLTGNSTPVTPEMVSGMVSQPEYLEGGMMFLLHDGKPIGLIRGAHDTYEDLPVMNIGPIAILPSYQGKGLGKQLLRIALQHAWGKGIKKAVLCVNADNEKAKELYLKEGFVEAEGVAAYHYFINNP